jgi:hypothetical protein
MSSNRRTLPAVALLGVLSALAACGDAASPTALAPSAAPSLASGSGSGTQRVELRDDCDSVSFNAAIGAGACIKRGSVTFDKMIAELTEKRTVGAWWINPRDFGVKIGTALDVVNTGGETHTFTRVAAFGGGVVPLLNQLSGTTTVAPECAASTAGATFVAAGGHLHVPTGGTGGLAAGTYRFQCCIHPWMRSTATVKTS